MGHRVLSLVVDPQLGCWKVTDPVWAPQPARLPRASLEAAAQA
jgi:hypothetical protein